MSDSPNACARCGAGHDTFHVAIGTISTDAGTEDVPGIVLVCGGCEVTVRVWLDDEADNLLSAVLNRLYPPCVGAPKQPLQASEET